MHHHIADFVWLYGCTTDNQSYFLYLRLTFLPRNEIHYFFLCSGFRIMVLKWISFICDNIEVPTKHDILYDLNLTDDSNNSFIIRIDLYPFIFHTKAYLFESYLTFPVFRVSRAPHRQIHHASLTDTDTTRPL